VKTAALKLNIIVLFAIGVSIPFYPKQGIRQLINYTENR
jgi:hypothetical protein